MDQAAPLIEALWRKSCRLENGATNVVNAAVRPNSAKMICARRTRPREHGCTTHGKGSQVQLVLPRCCCARGGR